MSEFTLASGRQASSKQAQVLNTKQYLTFLSSGETFGIGILCIKEIIEYAGLTEVPMMPPSIRGVINLRGAVVPVLDLAVRFGKLPGEVSKKTCIVIVEVQNDGKRNIMGVVVDAVHAVQRIAETEIEPAPGFGAKIRTDFIEGIGKVNGRFVILLNVSQVLSTEELGALKEADAELDSQVSPLGSTVQSSAIPALSESIS